jgi:magnesium transporter
MAESDPSLPPASERPRETPSEQPTLRPDRLASAAPDAQGGSAGARADPDEIRDALEAAIDSAPPGASSLAIAAIAGDASPASLAEAIAELDRKDLVTVLNALGSERTADVIAELDPDHAVDVLQLLPHPHAADVLDVMDPDDAADVVGELREEDAPAAERLLAEMEADEAADVRQLLAYPEDTAGGIMTTDFLAVSADATVAEAVQALRVPDEDELPPESASYLYVTDAAGVLVGVVPWHRLVRAGERVAIRALLEPQTISVPVSADQEQVAGVFRERHLLAIPVVDAGSRLLGIVTADDVADVIEEETTEDIERLGGSQPLDTSYLRAGPLTLARKRAGWLLLLFLGATYTGTVLSHFEDELQQAVALAFFIPLLIGTGGNVGSQTVMTVIRAMAVGEVEFGDVFRVWRKEAGTALLLGVLMGAAGAVRAWLLGVEPNIVATVAATAAVIVLWSATIAAILPLLLRRLRVDPAVVSAPMITTLVDGTGLFIYFEIARRLLRL